MALGCSALPAQSKKVEDLGAGKVLVMERQTADPVFGQSVILLIEYSAGGVVGVMLNHSSDVPLSRLREVEGTAKRSDTLYVGGPVEIEQVTALVRMPTAPPDAIHVAGDLYAVQSKPGLEAALKASKGPDGLRVYLGYCGWVIPQLQNEVNSGSWYIFDRGEQFAFDSAPGTLWSRLIGRAELRLALVPSEHRLPPLGR